MCPGHMPVSERGGLHQAASPWSLVAPGRASSRTVFENKYNAKLFEVQNVATKKCVMSKQSILDGVVCFPKQWLSLTGGCLTGRVRNLVYM